MTELPSFMWGRMASCAAVANRRRHCILRTFLAGIAAAFLPWPAFAQTLPTVFVIGDSTASNTDRRGWADSFADYFDPAKINVVNRARAGRSSRTFVAEGLWDRVRDDLKPGDFVLIQFGHNDGSAPDLPPARGSLPGIGDESKELTMPNGTQEVVHTFGWYMRKFIADTKSKGATPMVLSLTVRNIWNSGKVERGSGNFSQWSAEIARAEAVAFVDVTNAVADRYEKMGEEKVKQLFPQDHTHTSQTGADLNASLVIAGLKALKNSPLVNYLSAKGQAADYRPTLFLIGDSTVRNGRGDGANGQWGWGEPIVDRFDAAKIKVVNRALGGLSSRTFFSQGYWDRVLALLKPGDFVMMQFGHNDDGPVNDNFRARGSIKGTGDETQEIDNILTKQHEVVHSFGWYLRRFVTDARARGATPIVCSLIPRKIWKDGKIVREPYARWAADVAASEAAPFVDLNEIIAARYDELGPEKVDPLFADEHTHTTRAGAELNAACVIEGLKSLNTNPLAPYF